jgi:5-(carboxyamino)imidazole ribonucleotide mutase
MEKKTIPKTDIESKTRGVGNKGHSTRPLASSGPTGATFISGPIQSYPMPRVAIIVGSDSDKELSDAAASTLREFGVDHEQKTLSAHRNLKALTQYIEATDAQVFICIAGLAAALPGVVAAQTIKPVIGVPKEVKLGGIDSLLSIVQMPTGVPVATVGIDGAKNAAILAIEILALSDKAIKEKLNEYRQKRASG